MQDPVAVARQPHKIIRPSSGLQHINLREVWQFRDLLMTLGVRDIKLRYRQTALGAAWVVLQPLMAAGIFSIVFGRVAKLPSDGLPYFLFSYAGLLGWNAFNNTITKSGNCLVGNAGLVSKVAFPRLVLPLSLLFGTLVDFGVSLGMMAVLMLIYRIVPTPALLLLPVWLLFTLLLALGVGTYAAALTVSYRDVQYVLPVLTQVLLYASPVAYSVSAVPKDLKLLYFLNPVSGLLEGFRWSLLGRGDLNIGVALYAAVFSTVAFIVGALAFRKMERRFADVI